MNILVLNAGSATLKFKLFQMAAPSPTEESTLASGLVEKWGTAEASLRIDVAGKAPETLSVAAETPGHAAEHAISACLPLGIDAIGHRVVHGGKRYHEPTRITPEVIQGIGDLSTLAPLHNDLALEGIQAGTRLLPKIPAVAVFDTAFHQTMPEIAARYALPWDLAERNALRRYGFHGISHRFVSRRLLELLQREALDSRLITCHLGNGASVCAIRDGRSIDTSMGLTPMEGLVMGTRCGDIDPGLVLHLINHLKVSGLEVENLLNRQSGLLGLSGRSGDVRDLEKAAASGDSRATLALESFAYRAKKYLGAYAAALGGVDAVAFSGGIGEHSAYVRRSICVGLEFLGLNLNTQRNNDASSSDACRISTDDSRAQIWIVPTDEERQIAREAHALLS